MLGETPDIEQKEYLQKKFPSLIFLESDWEELHIRVLINSIVPGMYSTYICTQTVFAYCEEYGLNKIETLELTKHIHQEANSVKKS